MTRSKKKGRRYTIFTTKKETWDPDVADQETIKLDPEKTSGGGTVVKFEDKFFVLKGNETPELFLIWWKEFLDKIYENEGLPFATKIDVLKRIVKGTAKELLQKAIRQTGSDPDDHHWKWKIAKIKMKKLWEEGLTDDQIRNKKGLYRVKHFCEGKGCGLNAAGSTHLFSKAVADDDTLKEYQDLVLGEIHYRLAEQIIGADNRGKQAFIHTKRQIRAMPIKLEMGIEAYSERIQDLNSYLPLLP